MFAAGQGNAPIPPSPAGHATGEPLELPELVPLETPESPPLEPPELLALELPEPPGLPLEPPDAPELIVVPLEAVDPLFPLEAPELPESIELPEEPTPELPLPIPGEPGGDAAVFPQATAQTESPMERARRRNNRVIGSSKEQGNGGTGETET